MNHIFFDKASLQGYVIIIYFHLIGCLCQLRTVFFLVSSSTLTRTSS